MTQTGTASIGIPATPLPPSPLRCQRDPGQYLTVLERPQGCELNLTLTPRAGEGVGSLAGRLAASLQSRRAAVVQQLVFGPVAARDELLKAMRQAFGTVDWPVTWVEGAGCDGRGIAGIQVFAVAGTPVTSLVREGRPVGRVYDDGGAKHCVLGDLGPLSPAAAATEQAGETLLHLEAALALAGMGMKDVARTWLFLDDILSWYGPFNRVRNEFFSRNELRPASFPASTGVGGRNPRGAALTAGAWAIQPHQPGFRVQTVPSPAQCPAPAYGSAFSRAIEIVAPDCRRLLVSGTASIAPGGQTAHVGDPRRQIELTMEVVEAILRAREMTLADTTRATVYFKSAADLPLFAAWCARHSCDTLPAVHACCDICRDDLLFEIELDALKVTG
jgi:enamine deaminase RidA (YjgF/YER057c/UK114 family)